MEKVTRLGLHGTKIRDAGLKELSKMKQLKVLALSSTQITDAGLNEVAKLKQLEHLFLGDSKVTKAWRGVAELKKTLPQCETIHLAKK